MSWLGSGITQITGQISNFTKEVLTEGTEEVDDPATQLKLANAKIQELEALCTSQRIEVEKLKRSNEELSEKFESAELQINAISNEYRDIVTQKDTEINLLKQTHHELQETQSKLLHAQYAPTSSSPAVLGGDGHDFDDVISSQHQINQLRNEVQRLHTECQHWRQLAASNTVPEHGGDHNRDEDRINTLQAQVKELEARLHNDVDHHQRELAALQDVHSQKLSMAKRKHKEEVQKYEKQAEELREQLHSAGDSESNYSQLKQKSEEQLQELQSINTKLSLDLQQTHAADRQKTQVLEQLQKELQLLKTDKDTLQQKVAGLSTEKETLLKGIDSITKDKLQLQLNANTFEEQLQEKEAELELLRQYAGADSAEVTDDKNKLKVNINRLQLSSTPIRAGRRPPVLGAELGDDGLFTEQQSEIALRNQHLDQQVQTLQGQIETYEREIGHFELIKTDWQIEKEALEDVLLRLREDLRIKEESLNVVQAQKGFAEQPPQSATTQKKKPKKTSKKKGLMEVEQQELECRLDTKAPDLFEGQMVLEDEDSDLEGDIEELNEQVELLTQCNAQLENQRDILAAEKGKLVEELDKQRKVVTGLERQLLDSSGAVTELTKQAEDLRLQVKHKDQESVHLNNQLKDKEEEIDNMLQALNENESQRQESGTENQKLEALLQDKESEIERLSSSIREHDEMMKQAGAMATTMKEKDEELLETSKACVKFRTEKESLEESLQELDSQHQEEMSQIIQVRDTLLRTNEQMKQRILNLEKQLEELGPDKNNDPEQAAEMKRKLEEKETKFLQMQETNDSLQTQLKDIKLKMDNAAIVLNDMHMDKKALQDSVLSLQQELLETKSCLKSSKTEIIELKEYTRSLDEKNISSSSTQDEMGEEFAELQKEHSALQQDYTSQNNVIDNINAKLASQKEHEKQYSNHIADLEARLDSLTSQNNSLQAELEQTREKFREQVERQASYVKELTTSQQMDASSLQATHENTLQLNREKDIALSNQQSENHQLQANLHQAKDMLRCSTEEQQKIQLLLNEKESELVSIRLENKSLVEKNKGNDFELQKWQSEVVKLSEIENACKLVNEENQTLKTEVERLSQEVKKCKSHDANSMTLSLIADLESTVTMLNTTLEEKDNHIMTFRTEIKLLNNTLSEKESNLEEIRSKCSDLESVILKLNETIERQNITSLQIPMESENLSSQNQSTLDISSTNNHVNVVVVSSKEVEENKFQSGKKEANNTDTFMDTTNNSAVIELEKLRKIIAQKDNIILELKNSSASLMKLLEDRSLANFGDKTLVEIHRLQNEVRSLGFEKEQMMSVLAEKTRECSKMKGEVHNLMSVVSAEKAALSKLQQDNHQLIQNRDRDDPREEMRQEAVKGLSQLIRDRDLEIDALNQKNETLLQVLHDTSNAESHINSLLQERENLSKQVTVFHNDRQQILAALSTKHQESLAYHNEIQRLNAVISEENAKQDKLQREYAGLVHQYESKQQALLKAQNELLNYRQKLTVVDNRCKEGSQKHSATNLTGLQVETKSHNDSRSHSSVQNTPSVPSEQDLQEIAQLKEIIQSQENAFTEKDRIISEKDAVIKDKEKILLQKEKALGERERTSNELQSRILRKDDLLRSKESELGMMKKQTENLTFQLHGLHSELSDIKQDREQLQQKTSILQQELCNVKEISNRLSLAVNDKDFELSALKEKNDTLTRLMQEEGRGEKGEVDRMLKENEAIQAQGHALKRDRDQFVAALQQQQAENQELRTQINKLQEREAKLTSEVHRLRTHLEQIEDNIIHDALEKEELEKNLRNKLAMAEERAMSSSSAVKSANRHAVEQVESLQQQLHSMAEQRDNAVMQLSATQEMASQYATSLQNLQMVLEQFQQERQLQQAAEIEKYQKELEKSRAEARQLAGTIKNLQAQLDEHGEALEAAQRLSEQLDKKEELIHALRDEVQLREHELARSEEEVLKLSSSTEAKVDKALMRNLLLGYFHSPASKQREVLQLISRVLGFTIDELQQIGLESHKGWFGGLFRRVPATPPPSPGSRQVSKFNQSFSELFVKFLEKESSPPPMMRLPAEEMARELQDKQHQRTKPAFNPFSAPVQAALPLRVGASLQSEDSHLLMKPISSSLPVFTPLAFGDTLEGSQSGGSGRVSAASSGRSTPASSSAILRDLLPK